MAEYTSLFSDEAEVIDDASGNGEAAGANVVPSSEAAGSVEYDSLFSDEAKPVGAQPSDPRYVGNAGAPMRQEDFADQPAMGGVTKAALEAQADGGPVAERDDGSISAWAKNLALAASHNMSGRVASRNANMNLQDIMRGTVRKDGKDVPISELSDDEQYNLASGAGWNGNVAWLTHFLGPLASRGGDGPLHDWERTEGARISDPVEKRAARAKFMQDLARDVVLQGEWEKDAARKELQGREKQAQAGVVGGLVQTASYMVPFMVPGAHGVVAGLIGGADRGQEMASDRYEMDENGNVRVAAASDPTGVAVAKGVARGVVEPLIEMVGGTVAMKGLEKAAGMTLGKIPILKSAGGALAATAVGKALAKYGKNMRRFGRMTGLQGMPEESIEEFEDNVFDAALGIDRRESEKDGNALQRAGGAARDFFKPESLKNLAESMLLVQILGGGIAHVSDRVRSKPIDNLLAESAGIDKEVLKDYTADEKWAAYGAYLNRLSESEVKEKIEKGNKAIEELTGLIEKGTAEVNDFRDAAYAMYDGESGGGNAEAARENMDEANAAEGKRRAGGMLSADEAREQQKKLNDKAERGRADERSMAEMGARLERQGEEMRQNAKEAEQERYDRMMEEREEARAQNRAEVGAEGAESRPEAETGEETGGTAEAPEATETGATAEAESEAPETPAEPPVAERTTRLRRAKPNNFRHPGDTDNRLRPQEPQTQQETRQETGNETGNVRDEAPAQPEQGMAGRTGEQPEAPRPETGAETGTEAPRERVVEPSKSDESSQELTVEPPKAAETSAKTGTSATNGVENKPQTDDIGGKTAQNAEEPSVSVAEKPQAKTNIPKREKSVEPPAQEAARKPAQEAQTAQAAQTDASGDAKSDAIPVQTGAQENPTTQTPTQARKNGNKLRTQADANAAKEQRKAEAKAVKAEAEADAAEKQRQHEEKIRRNRVSKAAAKVKAIVDKMSDRKKGETFNIDYFRKGKTLGLNPNGLSLAELKDLYENDNSWHRELGLPSSEAEALRNAVRKAYEYSYMGNVRGGKYRAAHDKLRHFERHPESVMSLAMAHAEVAKAHDRAKQSGDSFGESLLERELVRLNEAVSALSPDKKTQYDKARDSLDKTLSPMERKNRVSKTTAEGKEIDIAADGEVVADVEDVPEAADDWSDTARLERIKDGDGSKAGGPPPPRGATGQGGSLKGNRHIRIDSVEGDKITATMMDAAGKTIAANVPMSREQWRTFAKASRDAGKVDSDNPQKGDMIRMSNVPADSLPQGVPAKWTAAERKPLERVANALRNVVTVGGKRIKVQFLDERPTEEGANSFKNSDGVTVGDYSDGEIRLYPGATVADVVHEFTHPLMDYARAEARAGRGEFLSKIKDIIDAERKTWDKPVRDAYKGKGEDEILEEVFTHAMGDKGAKLFGKSTTTLEGRRWYNRLWEAIKGVWRDFATKMGWNKADLSGLEKMTPEEAAQKILGEMAKGRNFGDVKEAKVSSVRESRRVAAPGTAIMDEERTTGERMTERFYDSNAPYKDLQDEVGGVEEKIRADGYTDHKTSTDFVAAKSKYNGRIEYEIRDLQRKDDDVKKTLDKARLDKQKSKEGTDDLLDDFNLFLAAEHAAERNHTHANENGIAYSKKYYHGMGKVNYDGADVGFSEELADKIRKDLRDKYGAKFSHFEDAAQKAYKIAADELKRRLDGDLLSQADYNYFHDRVASGEWKHYVPLKTDRARLGIDDGDIPLGTRLHRSEYRKASGRGETVSELAPYTDLILQAEQGIKKALRNELANVEANFIEHATNTRGFKDAAGNPLIAEIVPGHDIMTHGKNYKFSFADGSSVMSEGSSRLAGNHPEIHLFKRDGQLMAIRYVKGKHGRGLDVAKAASGDNIETFGDGILSKIPKFTHFMSAMRTQYSPEFTVSNYLADSLEAAQALIGRYGVWDGAAAFAKTVAAEIRNAKDVWAYVRHGELRGDMKKAVEAGLLTKGGVASAGFEGKEASIRNRLDEFRRSADGFTKLNAKDKAKWAWEHGKEFISIANEFMEYSTRVGLFSALHNKGVPVNEAVKFAREATVDFNRKGTMMPIINGLYMFANASLQGAARAVQAGKESFQSLPDDGSGWGRHKVKGDLVALLAGIGVAKAVIDNFLGDDDDREKAGGRNASNLTEYDKKHNVGIPIGGGRQVPLMRFRGPYAAIPYLAQTAMNVALGRTKPKEAFKSLPRELTDQITDLVGGNGMINDKGDVDWSLTAQSLAPSALDPVIQLASGKDYKGQDRLRRSFDKTLPLSSNGKRNTPAPYKVMAQAVNRLTRGNSLRKGWVDFAPEDAQLVWEFIGGGLWRDVGNVWSTAQNVAHAVNGGDTDRLLTDMPIVRRLVREYPESTGRYFDALDRYEADKAEYKKTTDLKRRAELKREHPYLTSAKGRVDNLVERIKDLTHLERGEIKSGRSWIEPKNERSEEQKARFRKERLRLQAVVLSILDGNK